MANDTIEDNAARSYHIRNKKPSVEIFKTDIQDDISARRVVSFLQNQFPTSRFNVDLHDSDKVLRIEGIAIDHEIIIRYTNELGHKCEPIH